MGLLPLRKIIVVACAYFIYRYLKGLLSDVLVEVTEHKMVNFNVPTHLPV